MELGAYKIPDIRLYPNAINDVKQIVEHTTDTLDRRDIAKLWKYVSPSTQIFYKRLKSLVYYGLVDGNQGQYRVTALAKDIYRPDDESHKKILYSKAVRNVPLWNELYKKFKKNPTESIYVQLKTITGAEPQEIEKVERQIRKRYLEDMALLSEDLIEETSESTNSYITSSSKVESAPMESEPTRPSGSTEGVMDYGFGKYKVTLPIDDSEAKKVYQKLRKMLDPLFPTE